MRTISSTFCFVWCLYSLDNVPCTAVPQYRQIPLAAAFVQHRGIYRGTWAQAVTVAVYRETPKLHNSELGMVAAVVDN